MKWLRERRYLFLFVPYLVVNGFLWPWIRIFVARLGLIDYAFVVYFGTKGDIRAYAPFWFQRVCSRVAPLYISVIGVIVAGKNRKKGLVLTLTKSPEEYSIGEWQELVEEIKKARTFVYALAGRIPSILAARRIPIVWPFVTGVQGTLFAITETLEYVLVEENLSKGEITVGVLGMGFIGGLVYRRLSVSLGYLKGVGVDVRFSRSYTRGNWISTNDLAILSRCDVVIVLTAEGSAVEAILPYLKENVVLLDDTHPEIPEDIKTGIVERGGKVYAVALQLDGVRFIPALPGFHPQAIPGCVVEALVVSEAGSIDTQDEFDIRARELGFLPPLLTWNSLKR